MLLMNAFGAAQGTACERPSPTPDPGHAYSKVMKMRGATFQIDDLDHSTAVKNHGWAVQKGQNHGWAVQKGRKNLILYGKNQPSKMSICTDEP
jgi:hypothetical protein